MDYKEIYDRKNLEEKKMLEDVLFVACGWVGQLKAKYPVRASG